MNTDVLDRLRDKMQRRGRALLEAEISQFRLLLPRFLAFVGKDETLAGITRELLEKNAEAQRIADIVDTRRPSEMPPAGTYELAAAIGYHVLVKIAKSGHLMTHWPAGLANWCLLDQMFQAIRHWWLKPFIDYLDEKLDEQATVLGLLLRYKKRCEWFNREELTKQAAEENQKDYAQVEDVLKKDLYRFLHDQGVNLTIEPASVRGRLDVIIDDGEGRRAYTEGKVFDNINRDKAYIRKGFAQLLDYMSQYNIPAGYLVIYQTCQDMVSVAGDGDMLTIPFLRQYGKTVFVLIIDVAVPVKATSQRDRKHLPILREELVRVADEDVKGRKSATDASPTDSLPSPPAPPEGPS